MVSGACSTPPPVETAQAEPTTEPPPTIAANSEPEPELSDEAAALIAESEGAPAPAARSAAAPTSEPAASDDGKGHNIVYRVKPDSLHIEVIGGDFVPRVQAVKVRSGWGVEVKVDATTTEDLSLLAGTQGPLAFAVKVKRPAEQKFTDERGSNRDLLVTPEKPFQFTRVWPGVGTDIAPLQAGQELEMQVGLWGLGDSVATRKPVRRFFQVKMKIDKKGVATVYVEPPK